MSDTPGAQRSEQQSAYPTSQASSRRTRAPLVSLLGGLAGASLGGVAGYFAFIWLRGLGWGLYPLLLPGVFAGLGCGALTGRRSIAMGVLCAFAGVIAGLLTEWITAPFVKDASLGFFLSNLGDLQPVTKLQLVLGGLGAFWFGCGREGGVWRKR